jgi:hypothetical protein
LRVGLEVVDEVPGVAVLGHLVPMILVERIPVAAQGHAPVAEITVLVDMHGVEAVGFLEPFQMERDPDRGTRLELLEKDKAMNAGTCKGRDRGRGRRRFSDFFYIRIHHLFLGSIKKKSMTI